MTRKYKTKDFNNKQIRKRKDKELARVKKKCTNPRIF